MFSVLRPSIVLDTIVFLYLIGDKVYLNGLDFKKCSNNDDRVQTSQAKKLKKCSLQLFALYIS